MNFEKELAALNELSMLDKYCYQHYCRTGRYMREADIGRSEIQNLLKLGCSWERLAEEVPMDEILAKEKYDDLSIVLSLEHMMFAEKSDTIVGKAMRYFYMDKHSHHYFELQCVMKGTAVYESVRGQDVLAQGDFVLTPPLARHNVVVHDDGTVITVGIRSSTFQTAFRDIIERELPISRYFQSALFNRQNNELIFRGGIDSFAHDLILMLYREQCEQGGYANEINNRLVQALLYYVCEKSPVSLMFEVPVLQKSRIWEMEMYLLEHYRTVTLQQLAAKFGLSVPYLSKLLKTAWGCGFAEILQHVRLERAKELLVTTALPITEISASVGYENDAYFISIFKKAFGITPQKYRREKTTQP